MLSVCLWQAYAITEGIRDGATFAHNNTNHPYNIHHFMNPSRAMVLFILTLISIYNGGMFYAAGELLTMILVWPFFHNGFYYETRRVIDGFPYRFWSQSKTTTAVLSFPFIQRLWMLLCGLLPYYI